MKYLNKHKLLILITCFAGILHAIIVYLFILNDIFTRYTQYYIFIVALNSLIIGWIYGAIKRINIFINILMSIGISCLLYYVSVSIIALITFDIGA